MRANLRAASNRDRHIPDRKTAIDRLARRERWLKVTLRRPHLGNIAAWLLQFN
jgi:hypothetical protein